MKEYKSSKSREKKLYKKVRKNYKRWKYGNLGVLIFTIVIIGIFLWIFKNVGVSLNSIIVGIGVNFVPFLITCFMRAVAVSGGREILLNRENNTICLYEDKLVVGYKPGRLDVQDYDYVEVEMLYSDILTLDNKQHLGYFDLSGCYVIKRFKQFQNDNPSIEHRSDPPLRVYCSYTNMQEVISEISKNITKQVKLIL